MALVLLQSVPLRTIDFRNALTFAVNLPLGGLVLGAILLFLSSPPQNPALRGLPLLKKLSRFDFAGTILFIGSIVCLLLALQWGGTEYAWSSGRIIALLVVFAVGTAAWIGVQYHKGAEATVPGRIIFQRSIAGAALNAFCMGGAFFVLIYFIPLWLQAVRGDSALMSGVHSLPMQFGVTIAELIAAFSITRMGYYVPFMLASCVIGAAGAGMLTTWTPLTGSDRWIGYQALYGLGVGLGWQQPLLVVQTVLGGPDIPAGTAVMLMFQLFGGALFISVAQNVFAGRLLSGLAALRLPGMEPAALLAAGATGFRPLVPADALDAVVEVYNSAVAQAFVVSVALAAVGVVGAAAVEWRSVKAKKGAGH